jgi:tetratricopeptide (TPR) repeat protein
VLWLLALGPPRPATPKGQTSGRRLRVPGRSILIGGAIGLAVIVRPTAVALLIPVTIEAWHHRRLAPRPLARLLVTVAVCAIVVLPVALENRVTSGSLMVQGYGGMNLFLGNDPAGTGLPSARLGAGWDRLEAAAVRDGVSSPAGQDVYYLRKMVRAILDQPARWVALTAGKALWLVQAEEVRDTHSYYFFSNASVVLRALPGFGATFPLAIVGFVLAFQSGRRPWFLVGCLLAFAVVCVASVVGSRYRLPLVPALVIPAGAAIAAIVERGRALLAPARAAAEPVLLLSPVVPYLVLLVVCVGATNLRGDARSHNFAEEWALTGRALMHDGRCADAEAAFHRALDADRGAGYAWDGLGACAFEANDLDAAERAFRNAVAADGDNAEAHYHVGVVQERRGAYDRALEEYRRALQISPATASFMIASARSLLAKGALVDAAAWYAKASAAQPTDADAHMGLARVAALAGDWTQGLGEAQRAAALRPSDPVTWLLCCQLAADAGDGATARVFLQKATDLTGPDALEVQLGWVYVARAQGNYDEVDQRLRAILQRAPRMSSAVQLFLQNADRRGRRAEADQFLRTLSPAQ